MSVFSVLTSKIFGGIALFLLVVSGLLWWQNGNLKEEVEEVRKALAACEAARATQNAAIERQRQDGERQREAYETAVREGNQTIREAQARSVVIRQTPRNGCPTPPQVMGAGL